VVRPNEKKNGGTTPGGGEARSSPKRGNGRGKLNIKGVCRFSRTNKKEKEKKVLPQISGVKKAKGVMGEESKKGILVQYIIPNESEKKKGMLQAVSRYEKKNLPLRKREPMLKFARLGQFVSVQFVGGGWDKESHFSQGNKCKKPKNKGGVGASRQDTKNAHKNGVNFRKAQGPTARKKKTQSKRDKGFGGTRLGQGTES